MLKVLIVDDNPMVRCLIRVLVREEYMFAETTEAPSVEKARFFLERNRYDVLFLDHVLMDGNGWEIAEMISKSPDKFGKPKIIAMSSSATSDEVEIMRKNFSWFIQKPFSVEDIFPMILEVTETK